MVEFTDHPGPDPNLPWVSPRQRDQLNGWIAELREASTWSGTLPVALLERCWLRLRAIPIADLALELPPDATAAVPELQRYRQLISQGLPGWSAQIQCWEEFGAANCQAAQRRFWQCRDRGNHGWTLARYAALVETYRRSVELGSENRSRRRLPLLVLARAGSRDAHTLHWLEPIRQPMRHTCA
jgi:hypothetical protein